MVPAFSLPFRPASACLAFPLFFPLTWLPNILKRVKISQGGVRFPTGGYNPRARKRRTGEIPVSTVKVWMEEGTQDFCVFLCPECMLRAYSCFEVIP